MDKKNKCSELEDLERRIQKARENHRLQNQNAVHFFNASRKYKLKH